MAMGVLLQGLQEFDEVGLAQGRAAGAVPARAGAALPPDRLLDGGDAPDPRWQAEQVEGGQRRFNTEYVALMRHFVVGTLFGDDPPG